jgi:putative hydrolase of the HAD superfamily
VSWVVFDYGSVISYPQPRESVVLLAAAAGCGVPEFSEAYWAYRLAYDRADLTGAAYWRRVGDRVGRSFSAAQITEVTRLDIESWLHLDPGTVALIEDLAGRGHPLAMLSNAPVEVAGAVAALPVAGRFEHCLFSCFLRLVKPDPAVYRAVLDTLGASPADVIFLDDRPENVAAAAAAGLRTVQFTDPSSARAELTRLGVATASPPAPPSGGPRPELPLTPGPSRSP